VRTWNLTTFQRFVLPQSSPSLWITHEPLKRRSTSTRLHGTLSQKAVTFILAAVCVWDFTKVRLLGCEIRQSRNYPGICL
jgi:hypothetical protein